MAPLTRARRLLLAGAAALTLLLHAPAAHARPDPSVPTDAARRVSPATGRGVAATARPGFAQGAGRSKTRQTIPSAQTTTTGAAASAVRRTGGRPIRSISPIPAAEASAAAVMVQRW